MLEIKNLSGIVTFARVVGTFTLGRAPRSSGPARPRRGARLCLALSGAQAERGLDPTVRRLFIIDGAKALSKAIRRTFGRDAAIQRCQIYKARNILERLPKSMHALGNGRRRKGRNAHSQSRPPSRTGLERRFRWILEGIDEMLTVTRLGLPRELRRSLACTNIIENVMGTVRRVCRNVKYWRSPSMALRWAAAAMQEATKGFRRSKAYKHLPALRAALAKQGQQPPSDEALVQITEAA